MKLHIFSDNHFDASPGGWSPSLAPGADVVVCAGDVCEGLPEGFRFLRTFIPKPTPIVTVAGNHSFYNRVMSEEWERGRTAAREHGVTLLENEAAVIGGVRFVGATLWTDYRLYGEETLSPMLAAAHHMADHRAIVWQREPCEWFEPAHAAEIHHASVAAINKLLTEPFDGPTVVVTHHVPHQHSIAPQYEGDGLNPAFASDLSGLIALRQPDLWVHGHTHASFDYRVGATHIVCNPHGYGRENVSGFDPACVVDLSSRPPPG